MDINYTCPECKEISPRSEWKYTEVECESCGEHSAIRCPRCDEDVDMTYHESDEFPEWASLFSERQRDV